MKTSPAEISVRAYEAKGLLVEQYAYTAGTVDPIPKHTHEEYQFALSFDHRGEYTYRGARHAVPMGRLSVVHPGEVHAPSDTTYLDESASFVMANIHPDWVSAVTEDITGRGGCCPFFAVVLPEDPFLTRAYLQLSNTAEQASSQLEKETALWNFLSSLVGRYAQDLAIPNVPSSPRRAVLLARDYLRDRYIEDISLDELATVAGLSRFHFCRRFQSEVGVSVGAYQTQLRLAEAKKLLAQGMSIAECAIATGFYDQSHFGKHFRRHVGTTPAKYAYQVARA